MADKASNNTIFLTDEIGQARAFRLGGKRRLDIYELKPPGPVHTEWTIGRTLGSWHPLHRKTGAIGPLMTTRKDVLRYVAQDLLDREQDERVRAAWRSSKAGREAQSRKQQQQLVRRSTVLTVV